LASGTFLSHEHGGVKADAILLLETATSAKRRNTTATTCASSMLERAIAADDGEAARFVDGVELYNEEEMRRKCGPYRHAVRIDMQRFIVWLREYECDQQGSL
jgi:hypothetical protein